MTIEVEVHFEGYLAELIAIQAEKHGLDPARYVLNFFTKRCNAPLGVPFLGEGCAENECWRNGNTNRKKGKSK